MKENKSLTGYPSVDKPWMKYYSEEAINAELPQCSLYEYLYENNKEHLEDYALNYFGHKITYGELFENIELVARAFVAQGVKEGNVCTIVTLSCMTSVLCFYALNKIGAVSNYVNVLSSQDELEKYFKEAESEIIVGLDLFGEKVVNSAKNSGARKVIVYSLEEGMPTATGVGFKFKMRKVNKNFFKDDIVVMWKQFLEVGKKQASISYKKDPYSVCFLAHTGGTTGFPKSVLLNDYQMNAVAHQYKLCFEYERKKVFLNVIVPFVVYGILTCMHMPLSLGFCTAIIPKFESNNWAKYIKKYQPEYILAVPSYITPMLEDKKIKDIDLSCILTIGVGGDGMNATQEEILNSFFAEHGSKAKVLKGYGMTEVCATAIMGCIHSNKIGSPGIPLVKNNLKIYDNEKKRELRYGEVGEVCMYCPSKMMGYKDNMDEMKNLLHIHDDGKEWVHTGDLGYIDEDGFLFLVGRKKRIILTSANGVVYKVYPNIPEEVFLAHEAVQSVCIVGVKREEDIVLKICVALKNEWKGKEKGIEQEIRTMAERELSEYMRPYYYEFRDKLPLTSVGKIDYRALEEKETIN